VVVTTETLGKEQGTKSRHFRVHHNQPHQECGADLHRRAVLMSGRICWFYNVYTTLCTRHFTNPHAGAPTSIRQSKPSAKHRNVGCSGTFSSVSHQPPGARGIRAWPLRALWLWRSASLRLYWEQPLHLSGQRVCMDRALVCKWRLHIAVCANGDSTYQQAAHVKVDQIHKRLVGLHRGRVQYPDPDLPS